MILKDETIDYVVLSFACPVFRLKQNLIYSIPKDSVFHLEDFFFNTNEY